MREVRGNDRNRSSIQLIVVVILFVVVPLCQLLGFHFTSKSNTIDSAKVVSSNAESSTSQNTQSILISSSSNLESDSKTNKITATNSRMAKNNAKSNTAATLPLSAKAEGSTLSPTSTSITTTARGSQQQRSEPSTGHLLSTGMSWKQFLDLQYHELFDSKHYNANKPDRILQKPLITCSADMVDKLAAPRLSDEQFKWCRWALSSSGGKVVVGKSWGNLKSKTEKEKFDALNCNSVNEGKNPSCDDSWGDVHIRTWQKNRMEALRCSTSRSSEVLCYKNDNNDEYCVMKNAMINFAQAKKVSRGGGMTPSKKFQGDFLSADCKDENKIEPSFPFPHLYSPQLSTDKCDFVYNGTLLMYSHDDIRNLGHTLNDVFNIWIMLWMQGIARYAKNIDMLNIDSFKLGHNFDDQPNAFFLTYFKSLRTLFKGIDFSDKTLCVKNLMVQPIPPRFFIWESWFVDLPCSFVGPSALYQRWNMHVRHNYNLLNIDRSSKTYRWKIMLVVRNEHSNMWGTQRTSRNYLNTDEIVNGLKQLLQEQKYSQHFELLAIDLGKLDFAAQLAQIAESSMMIGMHGAGLASSMHMSVGEPKCCAVLEMFPAGEFVPIRGHGNMIRKMGIHFDRLDITSADSHGDGARVPVPQLVVKVKELMDQMLDQPSCVLQTVIDDPYLEAQY